MTSDVLLAAADAQPTVRAALDRHLAERGDVYTDPAAFQRFIDGGGNEALYRKAGEALWEVHGRQEPRRALDIGCGDGRLTSALLGSRLERLDLVEPSANLLDAAVARLTGAGADADADPDAARLTDADAARLTDADAARLTGAGAQVVPHQMTAEQFVDAAIGGPWDVAQSTFALHALAPDARWSVLSALAPAVRRLVVIEFDVPAFEDRSPAHAAYAVERYAAGIAEYAHDDLVVQGFLMPVLVGQFDPTQPRHTWEQPIDAWVADLTAAGFHDVRHRHLHEYWWAPAHLIDATA